MMNLVRVILSIVLLFCSVGALFLFIFTVSPLKKLINLSIAYNGIIFFIIYNIFLQQKESYLIEFLVMIFVVFLLNLTININIINNIMKLEENEQ